MKLKEIAARISVHLKRFEADPEINKPRGDRMSLTPYYNAGSFAAGRYVGIMYIGYQGHSNISKEAAEEYLEWLDAGNVGKHYWLESRKR